MLFRDADSRVNCTLELLAEACPLWWSDAGHRPIDPAAINFNVPGGDILTLIYGDQDALGLLHIPPELAPEWGVAAVDKADGDELSGTWQIILNSCRAERTALPSLMCRAELAARRHQPLTRHPAR